MHLHEGSVARSSAEALTVVNYPVSRSATAIAKIDGRHGRLELRSHNDGMIRVPQAESARNRPASPTMDSKRRR
jgi:hypothetical protein